MAWRRRRIQRENRKPGQQTGMQTRRIKYEEKQKKKILLVLATSRSWPAEINCVYNYNVLLSANAILWLAWLA